MLISLYEVGSKIKKVRVGRGGKKHKTAGKGHNGQKVRQGGKKKAGGRILRAYLKLPKRGEKNIHNRFKNKFRTKEKNKKDKIESAKVSANVV